MLGVLRKAFTSFRDKTVDHDFLLFCDCLSRDVSAPTLGISYIICLSVDQYCLHHSDHHVDFSIEETK